MKTAFLPFALLLTADAFATPPTAPARVSVAVGEVDRVTIKQDAKKDVGWRSGTAESNLFVDELRAKEGETRLLIQGKVKGTYYIVLWSKGETDSSVVEVVVGDGKPDILPPGPTPTPPPIPEKGFRVLVVFESEELQKYPASQVAAMMSGEVRGYLNDKCATSNDGKGKEWAVMDKDTTGLPKLWQDAVGKAKGKTLPYIIISDGTTGFEGPLPPTTSEVLTLLKKYGG